MTDRIVRTAAVLCAAVCLPAAAGVATDGTLGHATTLGGPAYNVTADLGKQLGGNLFFSFSQFNLVQGESANFSGPSSVSRIISRVTGGPSSIDGSITSSIAGADFYFINPAGVMFGAHASVDVGGSFYVSSAHYLKLADGGRFDAANPTASSLTSAPPEAFGFLGGQGAIQFNGSNLAVSPGASFNVVGGDVTLDGAVINASAGAVIIASTNATDEITLGSGGIGSGMPLSGTVTLRDGALINAQSSDTQATGAITIGAGTLDLSQGSIVSENYGGGTGGAVRIDASVAVNIDGGGSNTADGIYLGTSGSGAGGALIVNTPQLSLSNGGSLTNDTYGPGQGGAIQIGATDVSVLSDATIQSRSFGAGAGGDLAIEASDSVTVSGNTTQQYSSGSQVQSVAADAGNGGALHIDTGTLTLSDGGQIATIASSTGATAGNGGDIGISAADIRLSGQSRLLSRTDGSGNGGALSVSASGSIDIDGVDPGDPTHTYSLPAGSFESQANGSGTGGALSVSAPQLSLSNAGAITSDNNGPGQGGAVQIGATDVSVLSDGIIQSLSYGVGGGGSLSIDASHSLTVSGNISQQYNSGSQIQSVAGSDGSGGALHIDTGALTLSDGGQIATIASSGGAGNGGNLSIDATTIQLSGQSRLLTRTDGDGNGGALSVSASGSISIDGVDPAGSAYNYALPAGSFESQANGSGAGGALSVNAMQLSLSNGGSLTSDTHGSGAGGALQVTSPGVSLSGDGIIQTVNYGAGSGGALHISATDVSVTGDSLIQSVSSGSGVGGDLDLDASHSVSVSANNRQDYNDGSQIISCAGNTGNGGAMHIDTGTLSIADGAQIATISTPNGDDASQPGFAAGNGGDLSINATDILLSGQSRLLSRTDADGRGGALNISASNLISIDGVDPTTSAYNSSLPAGSFESQANGSGAGGALNVSAAQLSVSNGGRLISDTYGSSQGGALQVTATDISVTGDGLIESLSSGSGNGGDMTIEAGHSLTVDGNTPQKYNSGSQILSRAADSGNGGNISIDTGSLTISGGGQIGTISLPGNSDASSPAFVAGNGGNLAISASSILISGESRVLTDTEGGGRGGDVSVADSGSLTIAGVDPNSSAYVSSLPQSGFDSLSYGSGNGGNETISSTGPLMLSNFGYIDAGTYGGGNGGSISVNAGDVQLVSGGFITTASLNGGGGTFGNAGGISIHSQQGVSVTGDGGYFADGSSDIGYTSIIGSFSFTSGNGGSVEIDAPQVALAAHGSISASTLGAGAAGSVLINTQDLSLASGSSVFAAEFNNGTGDAGSVTVNASRSVDLAGFSYSDESSINVLNNGTGKGGSIAISTPLLDVDGNSYISADNYGSAGQSPGSVSISAGTINLAGVITGSAKAGADGPDVTIAASQSIALTGSAQIYADAENGQDGSGAVETGNAGGLSISTPLLTTASGTLIDTATYGSGQGGALLIQAGNMDLSGEITAQSAGTGAAGSITLDVAGNLQLRPGATITTQTDTVNGGNISIEAGNLLYLDHAQITTSAGNGAAGTGNGGNISIDPVFTVLNDSQITANAVLNNGGNINIVTDHFIASGDSVISATSQKAVSGTITISSPIVDIGEGLARLPADYLDAARALRQGCAAGAGGRTNSFIVLGRGGFPASAGGPLFGSLDWLFADQHGGPGVALLQPPARSCSRQPLL